MLHDPKKQKKPVVKFTSRLVSIHTRNTELLSACVLLIGSVSILVYDTEAAQICNFFFGVYRCYPTFLAFTVTDAFPLVSAAFMFSLSVAFFVGALMGYRGHNIRAWVTLVMGVMWLIVAVNMFKSLPLFLPFPWVFLGIGLLLIRGFNEQWIRRR